MRARDVISLFLPVNAAPVSQSVGRSDPLRFGMRVTARARRDFGPELNLPSVLRSRDQSCTTAWTQTILRRPALFTSQLSGMIDDNDSMSKQTPAESRS